MGTIWELGVCGEMLLMMMLLPVPTDRTNREWNRIYSVIISVCPVMYYAIREYDSIVCS